MPFPAPSPPLEISFREPDLLPHTGSGTHRDRDILGMELQKDCEFITDIVMLNVYVFGPGMEDWVVCRGD